MERYWSTVPDVYKLSFWSILLLATIFALYWFTFRAYKGRWALMRYGTQVKAKVSRYQKIEMGEEPDKVVLYRCFLEFVNKAGEKVVIRPEEDFTYKFTDDAELTVFYLEENPQKFIIKELLPFQTKVLPFGILVVVVCLYKIILLLF